MALRQAGMAFPSRERQAAADARALAELPGGSIAAIFDSRADAIGTAVQILTADPGARVWTSTGPQAGEAIRSARSGRSLLIRLLRGFGDEELLVRDVLRQTDDGRSVLVVASRDRGLLEYLSEAAHIYRFGLWTFGPLR